MPEKCIFCEIVNKNISSQMVFENEKIVAFKDIAPKAPVHIVIIPRAHIASVSEIKDYTVVVDIFKAANQIAAEQGLAKNGFRIVVNCGPDAGQAVYHLHYHLLGGRKLNWPPG